MYKTVARILGALFALAGIVGWIRGGVFWPVEFHDLKALVPVHYGLLALGLALIANPIFVLQLLLSVVPERTASRLEAALLPGPPTLVDGAPSDITERLDAVVRRLNRRYFATLAAVLILVAAVGVVPFLLLQERAGIIEFRRDSRQLSRLIQDVPLDFSSADIYRATLRDTRSVIERHPKSAVAALHTLLSELYDKSVTTSTTFDAALAKVYDEHIHRFASSNAFILPPAAFDIPRDPSVDLPTTRCAILTALGVVANSQGDQGTFVEPYILGRQYLRQTLSTPGISDDIPSVHNALGVNYAGLLSCYTEYSQMFKGGMNTQLIGQAIGETSPLPRLTIARLADSEYAVAAQQSESNFAKARALNNRADLRIDLIAAAHLDGEQFHGRDQSDAMFLFDNIDPPRATAAPQNLWRILIALRSDLDLATGLHRDPHIFFTRAQLSSMTGELCVKYSRTAPPCGDLPKLASSGAQDLAMARQLQLPARLFAESRATELHLRWLWAAPNGRAALERLGNDGPP